MLSKLHSAKTILFWGSFSAALIIDQVTKYVAGMYATMTINRGISFGLFSNRWLVTILFIGYIVTFFFLAKLWMKKFPVFCGLFLGACFANLIDRVVFGGVRDWLPIPFSSLHNTIADWVILLSFLVFVVQWGNDGRKNSNADSPNTL